MSSLLNVPLLLLVCFALVSNAHGGAVQEKIAAPPPDSKLRVAILDFLVDDNSYRSATAATDFSRSLVAAFSKNSEWIWVERPQLSLVERELELRLLGASGGNAALRAGTWLQADLLVLGKFQTSNDVRRLLLEVVDQQRAELLAESVAPFQMALREPVSAVFQKMDLVAKSIESVLSQAKERLVQRKNQRSIAFLFCEGENRLFNSSELEQRCLNGLQSAVSNGPAYRLAHFPHANRARSEAELIFGGAVQSDWDRFQQVADYYVWAVVQGFGIGGGNDKVELHIWDGVSSPATIVLPTGAGTPAALAEQMVVAIMGALKSASIPGQSDQTRQQVFSTLWTSAQALMNSDRSGTRFFSGDIEGRKNLFRLVRLLETACFFYPLSREAQAARISYRWDFFGSTIDAQNAFWRKWKLYEAWGEHVEHFGFALTRTNRRGPQTQTNCAIAYVKSALALAELLELGNKSQFGYPIDTPPDVANATHQDVRAELVRRSLMAASLPETGPLLTRVINHIIPEYIPPQDTAGTSPNGPDPNFVTRAEGDLQRRLIEGLWPHLVNYSRTAKVELFPSIEKTIERRFAEAGKPNEKERLYALLGSPLNQKSIPERRASDSIPPPESSRIPVLFEMATLNVLPPELKPTLTSIDFAPSWNVDKIFSMAFHNNQLWVLANGLEATNLGGPPELTAELKPLAADASRLWSYDPAKNSLSLAPGDLGKPAAITSISSMGNDLWLGLAGQGIGRLDKNGSLSRVTNGLPPGSYYSICGSAKGIYSTPGGLLVYRSVPGQDSWKPRPIPQVKGLPLTPNVALLSAFGPYLFYSGDTTVLWDVDNDQIQNLDETFHRGPQRENSTFYAAADDRDSAIWLGGRAGLHFLEPEHHRSSTFAPPLHLATNNPLYLAKGAVWRQPAARQKAEQEMELLFSYWRGLRAGLKHAGAAPLSSPLLPSSRIPGPVCALAHDGEFLWLASRVDQEWIVMLLHKPTEAWVGWFKLPGATLYTMPRLVASQDTLWIGLLQNRHSGTCHPLLKVDKAAIMNIPRDRWVLDKISATELAAIEGWPNREQAIVAFFSGDYLKTTKLLGNEPFAKMDLESLYLMGCAYDAIGLNEPKQARKYLGEIQRRENNSVWGVEAGDMLLKVEAKSPIQTR